MPEIVFVNQFFMLNMKYLLKSMILIIHRH